jgi:hypothetical protein
MAIPREQIKLRISKILSCKGAEIRLNRKFLPEQTVILSFTVNPREEPYRDNTWKESPEGGDRVYLRKAGSSAKTHLYSEPLKWMAESAPFTRTARSNQG